MSDAPHLRPKRYPPPEFPPRKPALFAKTPPAIFPVLLGLIGAGLALKRVLAPFGEVVGLADLYLGLATGLWLFGAIAYGTKVARRPSVIRDDLQTLPGRAGLAALGVGAQLVALVVWNFAPGLAPVVLGLAFALHSLIVVLTVQVLLRAAPEARGITPVWHLSFVGYIVGALAAVAVGWTQAATVILGLTVGLAAVIWAVSVVQLIRRIPPVPLRPLLAIHLSPAALFASVAMGLGHHQIALGFLILATLIFVALLAFGRWITAGDFSALWGAFTFPAAAYATALAVNGLPSPALILGGAIAVFNAIIAWKVLKLWPGGRLANKTNAAEA